MHPSSSIHHFVFFSQKPLARNKYSNKVIVKMPLVKLPFHILRKWLRVHPSAIQATTKMNSSSSIKLLTDYAITLVIGTTNLQASSNTLIFSHLAMINAYILMLWVIPLTRLLPTLLTWMALLYPLHPTLLLPPPRCLNPPNALQSTLAFTLMIVCSTPLILKKRNHFKKN